MTYIEDLAHAIRLGVPAHLIPEGSDSLFGIYAVLARAKGTATTAEDVHDAWAAWMVNEDRRDHPALVEFAALDKKTQDADLPFLQAIHRAAERPGQ